MTIGELILNLPSDTKTLIIYIVKTNRKIINTELSLVFNKTCIEQNLLSAYTSMCVCVYIYLYEQEHTNCIFKAAFQINQI